MGAVSVFMTGNHLCQPENDDGLSFLLEVAVATVAFFVVVVVLTSLDPMFYFHRYRHFQFFHINFDMNIFSFSYISLVKQP